MRKVRRRAPGRRLPRQPAHASCATARWRRSAWRPTHDREAMRRFFHDLSPESRRRRFFTPAEPTDALVQRLADAHDPGRVLTLIVDRYLGAEQTEAPAGVSLRPIATASYLAVSDRVAEVAFAVDDRFQGKGLATSCSSGSRRSRPRHGFERFQATTLTDNTPMLEVFRDSGFEVRSKTRRGARRRAAVADAVGGGRARRGRARPRGDRGVAAADARAAAVAVVGASRDPVEHRPPRARRAASPPASAGPIYPVNPDAAEIDGLRLLSHRRATLPAGVDLGGHRRAARAACSPSSTTAPRPASSRWS